MDYNTALTSEYFLKAQLSKKLKLLFSTVMSVLLKHTALLNTSHETRIVITLSNVNVLYRILTTEYRVNGNRAGT